MNILFGRLFFCTVVVLYNYGDSLFIKFNLIICFVFDLLEYCGTTFTRCPFGYFKTKLTSFKYSNVKHR